MTTSSHQRCTRRPGGAVRRVCAVIAALVCVAGRGEVRAEVTRIEIVSREAANGGRPIGKAGAFEILRGRAHGESV